MEPDRLKIIWQQAGRSATPPARHAPLDEIASRFAAWRRRVRRRDLLEQVVALGGLAICLRLCFVLPSALARAGAATLAGASVLIIVMLYRARPGRRETDKTMTVRAFCEGEVRRVDAQIALLRSVALWYLAPTLLGANLLVAGLSPGWLWTAGYVLASTLLGAWVLRLNHKAVRLELVPLREELRRIAGEQS